MNKQTERPGFQKGAIVRVKLRNFVTYNNATFHPGPNLNMVIGPNGTGKSSLVCAICIGLGFSPNHLGRATTVGEFVKHGHSHGEVEIELAGTSDSGANDTVKVRIGKEDNSRKFWLNGADSTLKAVRALTQRLSIQIDNLCQFLPQDKVASFAGLTPIQLLHETLRAAAPAEMLGWQDRLQKLDKSIKEGEHRIQSTTGDLERLQNQQDADQVDVDRMRERSEIEATVEELDYRRVFLVQNEAQAEHRLVHGKWKAAKAKYARAKREAEPALAAVNQKEEYLTEIHKAQETRRRQHEDAVRVADEKLARLESFDDQTQRINAELEGEANNFKALKQTVTTQRRKISELQKKRDDTTPPIYNSAEWSEKVRSHEHEMRAIVPELGEAVGELRLIHSQFDAKSKRVTSLRRERTALESQEGQARALLRSQYPDIANGVDWLENNQDKFEQEVFGPAMLTCSVKDPRYNRHVQGLMGEADFLCFTTQTRSDHKLLSDQFYGQMKLDASVRACVNTLESFRSPMSKEELSSFGFDGFAIDYLDGPSPVLAMLCSGPRLHSCAVALKNMEPEISDRVVASDRLTKWVAGNQVHTISRRREYGEGAVTSSTRGIGAADRFWTDQPVSGDMRSGVESQLAEAEQECAELKEQSETVKARIVELQEKKRQGDKEKELILEQKNHLQLAYNQYRALPGAIAKREDDLTAARQSLELSRAKKTKILNKLQDKTIEQVAEVVKYKDKLDTIRQAHRALLEATVMRIEAESELETVKAKVKDITDEIQKAKESLEELVEEKKAVRLDAVNKMEVFNSLAREKVGYDDAPAEIPRMEAATAGMTSEQVSNEIEAEKAKLELIHEADPGLMRRYEKRAREIDHLKQRVEAIESDLVTAREESAEVRRKWEPRLDELIGRINDAFSHNFEQISCAGEVSVYKHEDFEQWSIQIKVKFRQSETLQLLNQHRQSGGERAVSTIFYLMSLQAMAQAPFRVVDEINQGMDPRNERMVHERMVEIACREHTSQYFLVTPKLLTDLRFDERMTVLCIASGEAMPDDAADRMSFKAMCRKKRALRAA